MEGHLVNRQRDGEHLARALHHERALLRALLEEKEREEAALRRLDLSALAESEVAQRALLEPLGRAIADAESALARLDAAPDRSADGGEPLAPGALSRALVGLDEELAADLEETAAQVRELGAAVQERGQRSAYLAETGRRTLTELRALVAGRAPGPGTLYAATGRTLSQAGRPALGGRS